MKFPKLISNTGKIFISAMIVAFSAPMALAANPLITNIKIDPSPYYINIPNQQPAVTITYDFNTGVYATANVYEQIRNSQGAIIYVFNTPGPSERATGTYTLQWNGKANAGANSGNLVPAGDYTLNLASQTASPPAADVSEVFSVRSATVPSLSNVTAPSTYNSQSGNDYEITYTLAKGSGAKTTAQLTIEGPNGFSTNTQQDQTNGSNKLTWNGKVNNQTAAPGTYTYKLNAISTINGYTLTSTTAEGSFAVTNNIIIINPGALKCAGFTDVSSLDANCAAITYVKSIGAMTGNPDGSFSGSGLLQRDQIAKIVLETFDKYNAQTDYCQGVKPFTDISESSWAYQYVCRGKALSIITGYLAGADAGYYRPARNVNRSEFLALLLRNLSDTMPSNSTSSYSDVQTGQWYSGYAAYSKNLNLFTGTNLSPTNFVSRTEVAQVIYKLNQLGKI